MSNTNLGKAKKAKNDSFNTTLFSIEQELSHYMNQFRGKKIICAANDTVDSNFFRYFALNFNTFGLKKLTCVSYAEAEPLDETPIADAIGLDVLKSEKAYKAEITKLYDINNDTAENMDDIVELFQKGINKITPLEGDGSFDSDEVIELVKDADIFITNVPFSRYRDVLSLIMSLNKRILIIGNKNAITYKETFELIRDNKLWIGYTSPNEFILPDGEKTKKVNGLCRWFTNLDVKKRHETMILTSEYSADKYPEYDNYNAIEVGKVADIPCDYEGVMGVPITFMDHYNPEQFKIIGLIAGNIKGMAGIKSRSGKDGPYINGKLKYGRILICNKHPEPLFADDEW